uniref:Ladinin-1 n=1 Tax=Geotrypetes seraphini TaxID=260995 RepID=A0A6P8NT65_GEOSA|nr:ladinin-1 [Geotrypetes seraphini]
MARNRRDWSSLSSLARQRTLEDEEEQEREQRRRKRNLSSTTDADTGVSVSLPATEQQKAGERVQVLGDCEPQETQTTQDDDQEFLEILKKREERRQRRRVEILQHSKIEQQNGDSESGDEQQDALEPKPREREEKCVGELRSGESEQGPGEQQHAAEPKRELKLNQQKYAGEMMNGGRDQKLNEQPHLGEQKPGIREQRFNKQNYAGELESGERNRHVGEQKSGIRQQKLSEQPHLGELKGVGGEQRLSKENCVKEPKSDRKSKEVEHQDDTPTEENGPSDARTSGDTAVLSTPANERDYNTTQLIKQMSLEGPTSPLSPTQKYRSQVFVSSMNIPRTKGAIEVGSAWKSMDSSEQCMDGKLPVVTDEDGKKPSTLEAKGRSVQRTASLKLTLSPVGEEKKEMGTEHQNTPISAKDEPVDAGIISPRAATGRSPLRRFSPKTSSFRIMIQKDQPESSFTRSASLRISSKNFKLDEKLEKYASAVQKSEMIKSPVSTKKDFISLPTGINSKRSIFEKEAKGSGVTSPTSRKETLNTSGRVASRINQWLGKTQEESSKSTETKDERKRNLSAKRNLWD